MKLYFAAFRRFLFATIIFNSLSICPAAPVLLRSPDEVGQHVRTGP